MNSVSSHSVPSHVGISRLLPRVAWVIVLSVAAFFLATRVPRYLVLTEQSYGPYFWPRSSWVLPHVIGGLLAILIGPLQFWSRIRREYIQVHSWSGRVYLIGVVVGGIASFGLAATSQVTLTYAAGLAGLGLAWLTTAGMALAAVLHRNFALHRQWMIRSYVVTMAFVTFRVVEDLLEAKGIGTKVDRLTLMSWACWAVPLLFTEVAFQAKAVFSRR